MFPLWKPHQGLAFPAAFAEKAWAHIWVWPTRDTIWYTRKEEGGEPSLAVGIATSKFPGLECRDANKGTYGPLSAPSQAKGSVHVSWVS